MGVDKERDGVMDGRERRKRQKKWRAQQLERRGKKYAEMDGDWRDGRKENGERKNWTEKRDGRKKRQME